MAQLDVPEKPQHDLSDISITVFTQMRTASLQETLFGNLVLELSGKIRGAF